MAGRKRAVLTATGVPAELARRLRALRDESGLTLRQLAVKSGFSQSALSLAESGRSVPSWDVISAFVQGCGHDSSQWSQLWEVARAGAEESVEPAPTHNTPVAETVAVDAPGDAPIPARSRGRRTLLIATVSATGAAVIAASVFAATVRSGGRPTAPTVQADTVAAQDGTDPYSDRCKADEKQLEWQPVLRADRTMFGTIVLIYSASCQAAWGYLDGPNSSAWTTHIIAHRIPGAATAPSQFDGDTAYGSWGNVLSTRTGCVYIEAYVVDKAGEGPHAKTACIQPRPPSAP